MDKETKYIIKEVSKGILKNLLSFKFWYELIELCAISGSRLIMGWGILILLSYNSDSSIGFLAFFTIGIYAILPIFHHIIWLRRVY